MKKVKLFAYLVAGLFIAASCNNDDDDEMLVPETDRAFAVAAADGGMLEVRLGQLAQERGMSQGVKEFGQMMVTDHTKANEELMAIANFKGITLPTTLSTAKQQKVDSLSAMQGMAFDSTFARMMVASHQETITLFRNEANNGEDADLKGWASSKIPTLEQHLEHAMMLRDSVMNHNRPTNP
ncbi:hypothetical protein GCM10027275_52270 [Rhabdobacter roseus]|uniref:Putative membrane protein n=1 Tax=Rhabdobacter roseus TaxID=1655419 RepID=A0A840TTM2_9BACT|nr:DUF4142 domain-containing protein [Rhabdobacter roseus]MBB5287301.1 putative membrane protein [Rhabdobacter roseus]